MIPKQVMWFVHKIDWIWTELNVTQNIMLNLILIYYYLWEKQVITHHDKMNNKTLLSFGNGDIELVCGLEVWLQVKPVWRNSLQKYKICLGHLNKLNEKSWVVKHINWDK